MKASLAALVALVLGAGIGSQLDWALISSEHRLLRGLAIVEVGSVSKESYTDYGRYETIEWLVFESPDAEFCFVMPDDLRLWGVGKEAAMVVMDAKENLFIVLLENRIGNIAVDLEPLRVVTCQR